MSRGAAFVSLCALSFVLLASSGSAGETNAPAVSTGYEERVDVYLREITFVALDKEGKPVTDLRRDEVRLWEDGHEQQILLFEPPRRWTSSLVASAPQGTPAPEVSPAPSSLPGATPPEASPAKPAPATPTVPTIERRWVVLYFDALSLSVQDRMFGADAAKVLLEKELRPDDKVTLIVGDDDLRVLVPFTTDHQAVIRSLGNGEALSVRSRDLTALLDQARTTAEDCRRDPYPDDCAVIGLRNFRTEIGQLTKQSFRQFDALIRSLAAIPDRKLLFYFSDGVLTNPGEVTYSAAMYGLGEVGRPQQALRITLHQDFTTDFNKLLQLAVRSRIGVYPVNCFGRRGDEDFSPEKRLDGSPETNVKTTMAPVEAAVTLTRKDQQNLALATGGVAVFARDAASKVAGQLGAADGVYTLGYRPDAITSGPVKLKIKVDRPKTRVVFLDRLQPAPAEANLRAGGELKVEKVSYDAGMGQVRLQLTMPTSRFVLAPDAPKPVSVAAVFIEVTLKNGQLLSDHFETVGFPRKADPTQEDPKESVFRRPFALRLPPGDYDIRVTVHDAHGPLWGTFSAPVKVETPAEAAESAAISGQPSAPPQGSAQKP